MGDIIGGELPGQASLPYSSFIATPLLPCGEADGGIEKFTGNDEIGPVDNIMTMAIHAFAHFTMVFTKEYMVFCDLQGMCTSNYCELYESDEPSAGTLDKSRVMCLIDPQAHTYTVFNPIIDRALMGEIPPSRKAAKEDRVYWDLGPANGIEKFKKQHLLVCSNNVFCNKLDLRETIVEPPSPEEPPPSKHSVGYLIHNID